MSCSYRSHRHRLPLLPLLTVLIAMALMSLATTGIAAGPGAELSPTQVVQAQLDALRDGDTAAAYRYASPANHAMIGSASDFETMLQRQYADMITQQSARVTLKMRAAGQARVLAELTQASGQQSAYVFLLSRQTGGACDGCWMTGGVFPLQPANDQPLYSI